MFGSDSCDSLNGSYQLPFVDLTAFFFGHQHFGGFRLNVRNHWFGELSFCQFQEWANEEKKLNETVWCFTVIDTLWVIVPFDERWVPVKRWAHVKCQQAAITSAWTILESWLRFIANIRSPHTHTHITFVWHNFFPRRLEAYVYLNFGTFSIQHRNGFVLKHFTRRTD